MDSVSYQIKLAVKEAWTPTSREDRSNLLRYLDRTNHPTEAIGSGSCIDPAYCTEHNNHGGAKHKVSVATIADFGGGACWSPSCPTNVEYMRPIRRLHYPEDDQPDARVIDYELRGRESNLRKLIIAVRELGVRVFELGTHGPICRWMTMQNIGLVGRVWLVRDAVKHVGRISVRWSPDVPLKVFGTLHWHPDHRCGEAEHHKTWAINADHPHFGLISVREAIRMSDRDYLSQFYPERLERILA